MRYSANTLSRRYEMPTCLLEIQTERSPLSEWQSQTVAQNLRFQLRLGGKNNKTLKGNQQQISYLIEAVTNYCDRWLAQEDFESLDHVITIPKLSSLRLSTLQLFDLYESLELCASELVILPNLVLEVRRFSPNWLKILAGAIAIIGVSFGTVRLVSRDQPSFQMASPSMDSSPDTVALQPAKPEVNSESKSANKSPNQSPSQSAGSPAAPPLAKTINPPSANTNPDTNAIASPPPSSPQSKARTDREFRPPQDLVASSPNIKEPEMADSMILRQRSANAPTTSPSLDSAKLSGRAESANQAPASIAAEAPSTAMRSPKVVSPAAPTAGASADRVQSANIKVLQITSQLPDQITANLTRYLQSQSLQTSQTGVVVFDAELAGDRLINIKFDAQGSTFTDSDSEIINKLEDLLRQWRSPSAATGKIRLIIQT
ncbi:after-VIT domain-containing protein [Pseudanabaena biceps]|nr:after-VIT domain-containing protein [Pseudanabaena biceps]